MSRSVGADNHVVSTQSEPESRDDEREAQTMKWHQRLSTYQSYFSTPTFQQNRPSSVRSQFQVTKVDGAGFFNGGAALVMHGEALTKPGLNQLQPFPRILLCSPFPSLPALPWKRLQLPLWAGRVPASAAGAVSLHPSLHPSIQSCIHQSKQVALRCRVRFPIRAFFPSPELPV